ncbi:hypothetical protein Emed_003172 [Eimeria media]
MLSKDQVISKRQRCSGTSCPPLLASSNGTNNQPKDEETRQPEDEIVFKQATPTRGRSPTRRCQAEFEEGFCPPGCQNVNRPHPSLDISNQIRISNEEFYSQTAEWFVNESLAGPYEPLDFVDASETEDIMCDNDEGQFHSAHSTENCEDQESSHLSVENPFEIELLYHLVGAPKKCLQKYIDKICQVENELAAAMARGNPLYYDELQQLLELTAEFGWSLVQDEEGPDATPEELLRDPCCSDEEEIKFQLRIAEVQLNFCLDDFEVQQGNESHARATIVLLQRQAKCVKIIQLFRQLGRRQLWTYGALMSLMEELWCTPFAELSTRFANLTALYNLALTITQLPAEKSALWTKVMPEDIKGYTLLFGTKTPRTLN